MPFAKRIFLLLRQPLMQKKKNDNEKVNEKK